ncbi:MAG TPA: S-methyl-5'-thioinosine phosphorylase [Gammaproteobacteria bacterium]
MQSKPIGIIGGTALEGLEGLKNTRTRSVTTPYGEPSSVLTYGEVNDAGIVFLNRHGAEHSIPPHLINYRANIWALQEADVSRIVALASVGGITEKMGPGVLVIPDQLIDYTYGRRQTCFDENFRVDRHIDFTRPYGEPSRQWLIAAAAAANEAVIDGGTYGCTQGPRLETAAEVKRMARDGCDIVGMTGMPEAALARELGIDYACFAMVVNWAAGVTEETITIEDIRRVIADSNDRLLRVLAKAFGI